MPHITNATFPHPLKELNTIEGWMKVNYQGTGGGLYQYNFDTEAPNYHQMIEKLRMWLLGYPPKDLDQAVPELSLDEMALCLKGKAP